MGYKNLIAVNAASENFEGYSGLLHTIKHITKVTTHAVKHVAQGVGTLTAGTAESVVHGISRAVKNETRGLQYVLKGDIGKGLGMMVSASITGVSSAAAHELVIGISAVRTATGFKKGAFTPQIASGVMPPKGLTMPKEYTVHLKDNISIDSGKGYVVTFIKPTVRWRAGDGGMVVKNGRRLVYINNAVMNFKGVAVTRKADNATFTYNGGSVNLGNFVYDVGDNPYVAKAGAASANVNLKVPKVPPKLPALASPAEIAKAIAATGALALLTKILVHK